jgi:hypothetical protein
MNLPSEAGNFLDAAVNALTNKGGIIHYYAFASRHDDYESIKDAFQSAVTANGRKVQHFTFCSPIREVAPNRVQLAVDALVGLLETEAGGHRQRLLLRVLAVGLHHPDVAIVDFIPFSQLDIFRVARRLVFELKDYVAILKTVQTADVSHSP